ncbi:MAG: radical SAM protein [Bdellovibrionales bacterium]|nr:radical SAM protein [Bdellovibrionales bacterium]
MLRPSPFQLFNNRYRTRKIPRKTHRSFLCYVFDVRETPLLVTEIFHSLQGETSLVGVPFVFVRLTGCNLRCAYCDSAYAFKGGTKYSIAEILEKVAEFKTKHVLLTGGEPLLQRPVPELASALARAGHAVSIETHGEASIEKVAPHARIIMDVKTPASKMNRGNWRANLPHLKAGDEVKFVIASPEDYAWARGVLRETDFPTSEILFSPVMRTSGSPGDFPGVDPTWLAERILEDRLPVRMQVQLHKILWGNDRRGV